MPKVSTAELEALAHKELNKHMTSIEETFTVARSQTNRSSVERLKVVRNLLQYHVVKISNFLDEFQIPHQ